MNRANVIYLYSIFDKKKINKYEIPYDIYFRWESLDDIGKITKCGECKLAYFDEEEELINMLNSMDFSVFQDIIFKKTFVDNKVVAIAYNSNFDSMKSNTLQKFRYLIQSTTVCNQTMDSSVKANKSSFLDEITSSSSSSPELSKSKRHRSLKRYSAEIKKELNWLTGSEVTDGETIVKKWRIKNIGLKKWKLNSIKCVLLPSEYSNWVTYENIKVPVCFPDQKVDIEMEITIAGKWPEESRNSNHCPKIKLKWLLFMEKLVKEVDSRFTDYILAQLELVIKVRPPHLDSVYKDNVMPVIQAALSESSIEKVDQDFSIVDISDEDENKKLVCEQTVEEPKKIIITKEIASEIASEIDIELPDCPNGDDFQITDFHEPDLPISTDVSIYEKRKISYNKQSSDPNVMTQNDVLIDVGNPNVNAIENSFQSIKKNSTNDDPMYQKTIEIKAKNHEGVTISQPESIQNEKEIDKDVVMNSNEIETNLNEQIESVQNEDVNTDEHSTHVYISSINESVQKPTEIMNTTDQVSNPESVVLIIDENLQDNQAEKKTPNNMEIITSELNPTVIDDLPNVGVNIVNVNQSIHYPSISDSGNVSNQGNRNETNKNTDSSQVLVQQPYIAGLLPDIAFHNPTAPILKEPPYIASNYPNNILWHMTQNFNGAILNMPSNTLGPTCSNHNPNDFVPSSPIGAQVPFGFIQNESSSKIIQDLAKNGNIPININDMKWIKAKNGNHYEATQNMQRLVEMGFSDREKNFRLLEKFDNNINDVIQELID